MHASPEGTQQADAVSGHPIFQSENEVGGACGAGAVRLRKPFSFIAQCRVRQGIRRDATVGFILRHVGLLSDSECPVATV